MNLSEIDRLIAEKVMGWKLTASDDYGFNVWDGDGVPNGAAACLWQPSTDPTAARLVRENLSRRGWNYELGRYGSIPAIFSLVITQPGRRFEATVDAGEELATCLCALKAYGVDVDEKEITQ